MQDFIFQFFPAVRAGRPGEDCWGEGDRHIRHELPLGERGRGAVWQVESPSPYPVDIEQDTSGDTFVAYGEIRNSSTFGLAGLYDAEGAAAVLRVGWEKEGRRFLNRLRGPIAGLLWNARRGQVLTFRDKLGLLPLFFSRTDRSLSVSSSPKLLLRLLEDGAVPNRRRLAALLMLSQDFGREYVFEHVYRVRPRELIQWDLPSLERKVSYYWSLTETNLGDSAQPAATARMLYRTLRDTVAALPGDPHWHALSGGLDSTTLAVLEHELVQGEGESPVVTGTMVAEAFPETDESRWVEMVMDEFPLENYQFDISDNLPLSDLYEYDCRVEWGPEFLLDETWWRRFLPFMTSCTGRRNVVVGLGGDRLFQTSRGRLFADALQRESVQGVGEVLMSSFRGAGLRTSMSMMGGVLARGRWGERMRRLYRALFHDRPSWMTPAHWVNSKEYWPGVSAKELAPSIVRMNRSNASVRLDMNGAWPMEKLLLSLQRRSRRNRVRFLCPMLDPKLWELCSKFSPSDLRDGSRQKLIVREAMSEHIPDRLRLADDHTDYGHLTDSALTERYPERVRQLLTSSRLEGMGLIDVSAYRQAFDQYVKAVRTSKNGLDGYALWQVLAVEQWLRELELGKP